MNVTTGMWEMVSGLLEGEKLPVSMNEAIEGLCNGTLMVQKTNAEPVAWMYDKYHTFQKMVSIEKPTKEQGTNPIPLYTTPQDQANRIGVLEANHKIQLNINEKALKYIAELEKDNEAFVKIASDENKIAIEAEQRLFELEKQIKDGVEVGIAEGFVRAHKPSAEPLSWVELYRGVFIKDSTTPQTSAEPIAWVYPEGLEQLKNGNPWTAYGIGDDGRIPLYTTPQTKPLLVKVVKDHIEDLHRCLNLFRSCEMDNTADEMEVAIKELKNALYTAPQTNVDAVNTSQECVDKTGNNRHEPVAWVMFDNYGSIISQRKTKWNKYIPLYTTPQTKPRLSDEEIYKLWFNYGCGMPWTANTKTFARAIEERILGK